MSLAVEGGFVEGGGILDGLDVGEDGAVRECGADVGLDSLEELVALLDRPAAGYEDVHGDEGAATGLAVADGVEADALAAVGGERRVEGALLAGRRGRGPGAHRWSGGRG